MRALAGILAGLVATLAVLWLRGEAPASGHAARAHWRLVPEDASGALRRVAIHYTPAADRAAVPVFRQLLAALPDGVEIEVAVEKPADFDRLVSEVPPQPEGRLRMVVVGNQITTWSRDRLAALVDERTGVGGILTPPRVPTRFADRAGDASVPYALSHRLYDIDPTVADYVFEGGDLAASRDTLFVDANLLHRNEGRGDATREQLTADLERTFHEDIVWLGDEPGDVPVHHIMMYMVPVATDDTTNDKAGKTVAVGDVRLGAQLLAQEPAGRDLSVDADTDGDARRFDRVAEILSARGYRVVRFPVVVLAGQGSYVTYTNALFDRQRDGQRVVYLPTYGLPALDADATRRWQALGYEVRPVDVTTVYRMNGSLGCLVNVLARE